MFLEERYFDTAKDLLNHLCSWNNDLSSYAFRGQSSDEYKLLPSSLRLDNKKYSEKIFDNFRNEKKDGLDFEWFQILSEFTLIRDFHKLSDFNGLAMPDTPFLQEKTISKYDRTFATRSMRKKEPFNWIPNELLNITALAQHNGIPTRLLDWTRDSLVAAYFASKESNRNKSKNLVIWCLNLEFLSFCIDMGQLPSLRIVTPPYFGNNNLTAQKGLFTHIHTKYSFDRQDPTSTPVDRTPLDVTLEKLLQKTSHQQNVIIKLILPNEESKNLSSSLLKHGYGEARIFPGFKGVANQILSGYN